VSTNKLLRSILVCVTALVVAGLLLDSSLPIEARIVGICLLALTCWGYWKGLIPPG
jgi:hypothetical protein